MNAFFAPFDTKLSATQLAGVRRRLAKRLRSAGVHLQTLKMGSTISIAQQLAQEAQGAALVAIDDAHAQPADSPPMRELAKYNWSTEHRPPQVVYLTANATAEGYAQTLNHPLVRHYVKRDPKGHWIASAATLAAQLAREASLKTMRVQQAVDDDSIVGASACFLGAVAELTHIIRSPYGMISGEAGVGKLFLIRALWHHLQPGKTPTICSCGSFFRDYYVGNNHRRVGGGREGVTQLAPYIHEADKGLLVLHHVERLPTALQEELVARLSLPYYEDFTDPVIGVDNEGLVEGDLRIIATSTQTPQMLQQSGRLLPELALKLDKRHVRIPSLAQRGPEDIELVCHDILRRIAGSMKLPDIDCTQLVPAIDASAMRVLRTARYPNNISDLLRWLEYAWRHCAGGPIRRCHLPPEITPARRQGGTLDQIVAQAQRSAIQNALDQCGHEMRAAAAMLGRNQRALYRLMNKLGMMTGQDQ